jgi:hypothetical protein
MIKKCTDVFYLCQKVKKTTGIPCEKNNRLPALFLPQSSRKLTTYSRVSLEIQLVYFSMITPQFSPISIGV